MFAICFLPLHKLCVFFRFPFTLLILLQDPNRANVDDTGYSFDRELAQQLRPTPAMFLPPPQALRPLSSFHLPLFFLVDPNFRPIVHDTVYLPDWNQQATAAPLLLQPLPPSFVSSSSFHLPLFPLAGIQTSSFIDTTLLIRSTGNRAATATQSVLAFHRLHQFCVFFFFLLAIYPCSHWQDPKLESIVDDTALVRPGQRSNCTQSVPCFFTASVSFRLSSFQR
jgi:hypothetical protein